MTCGSGRRKVPITFLFRGPGHTDGLERERVAAGDAADTGTRIGEGSPDSPAFTEFHRRELETRNPEALVPPRWRTDNPRSLTVITQR